MSAEQNHEAGLFAARLNRRNLLKTAGTVVAGIAIPPSASEAIARQNTLPQEEQQNQQQSLTSASSEALYNLSYEEMKERGWDIYGGFVTPLTGYVRADWTALLYKTRKGEHQDRFVSKRPLEGGTATTVMLDFAPVDANYTAETHPRIWEVALNEDANLPANLLANISTITLPDENETVAALLSAPIESFKYSPMEFNPLPNTDSPATYHSLMFERDDTTCFLRATIPQDMEKDLDYLVQMAGLTRINHNWVEPEPQMLY